MTVVRPTTWALVTALVIAAGWGITRDANVPSYFRSLITSDAQPRAHPPNIVRALDELPLYFVENRGQSDARASHYIVGKDKTIFFTPQGVSFVLNAPPAARAKAADGAELPARWTVALDFLGANPVAPMGLNQTRAVISHFRGQPDAWNTGMATYAGLRYTNLWPGIGLDYAGARGRLKYTFNVEPGADPGNIQLAYRGAESVQLSEAGGLAISTPVGKFDDSAPIAWQVIDSRQVDVPVRFILEPGKDSTVVRFALGDYDPAQALIIDPAVLVYAGFIGGSGQEGGTSGPTHGIAIDSAGNAYVVGTTNSSEATFPASVGPDLTHNGVADVFVAKINSTGTALLYAGYIGGLTANAGYAIAVDSSGAAYVTGSTFGSGTTQFGFPQIIGPSLTVGGGEDAFVAKINPGGTALDYCGYIGGSGADLGYGIAVDSTGAAYVTGYTASTEATLPVTVGPDLTYNGGAHDVFVAKVNPAGTGFDYLGYLGGSGDDIGRAIALDGANAAYVTGSVGPAIGGPFPVTAGSLDTTYNGGTTDAFVAKISAAGTSLDYSGYLGGSGADSGNGIAVDNAGAAYVTGDTTSNETTFPITAGSLDTTFNGIAGTVDAFIAKVNPAGAALVYAGYIGGNGNDFGYGIAVDGTGAAYITGSTTSSETTFPEIEGPDLTFNGGTDAFVAKITASGNAFVYAGYIGGSATDIGWSIAVNNVGDAFISGRACSSEASFPVTAGPDLTYNGACDDFVAKVNFTPTPTPNINVVPTAVDFGAVSAGANTTQTITVNNAGTAMLILGALGAPAAPFSRVGGSCTNNQTLAPNSSCTVDIQFAPLAAGAAASSFNIPSDDPDAGSANGQNNVLVSLSGSGTLVVTPNINVNPVTVSYGTVNVGSSATQTITVSNSGAATLTLGTFGTPAAPFSRTGGTCIDNQILAPAASCTVIVQFAPAAAGAAASSFNIPSDDPDAGTANGQNNALVNLSGTGQAVAADLVLGVSASPNPVDVGGALTYALTVTNLGPLSATGVELTDSLPKGVTFVSATPSQGSCSVSLLNVATCTLGGLAVGASATLAILVAPTANGVLSNTATVTGTLTDPNTPNNSVTTLATAGAGADLSVAVTSVPFPAVVGENLTYTLTITNNGPGAASGVVLDSTLPADVIYASATSSQGSCSDAVPVSCALGGLANDVLASGASATVTLVVIPASTGILSHNVSVAAFEFDPDPANNNSTTIAEVVERPRERAAAALGGELLVVPMLVIFLRRRRPGIYL